MKNMKSIVLAIAVVALSGAGVAPSQAVENSPVTETTTVEVPMYIGGYDEDVAKANGFEIVTDSSGAQSSVAITEKAKKIVREMKEKQAKLKANRESDGEIDLMNIVYGNCGSSSLNISRRGSNNIAIGTSYSVTFPAVSHVWSVIGNTSSQGFLENFDGLVFGGASTASSSTHEIFVNNNISAAAQVTSGSYAQLVTGGKCFSGLPSDSY